MRQAALAAAAAAREVGGSLGPRHRRRLSPTAAAAAQQGRAFSVASSSSSSPSNAYDVVIVGGGAAGSSIAFHAASALPKGTRIAVVERDPRYRHASTPLSAGGIRQQFSLKENIQMSIYGADFIKRAGEILRVEGDKEEEEEAPTLQFKERGYLFLASAKGEATMRDNHRRQRETSVDWVDLLSPEQLQREFPWMSITGGRDGPADANGGDDDTDDSSSSSSSEVVLGSVGRRNEGYFDPWLLLQALKRKAVSLGVEYIKGEARGVTREGRRITAIDMDIQDDGANPRQQRRRLAVGTLINAAGAFADEVVGMCSKGGNEHEPLFPLPVRPRRRQIFSFHCPHPAAPPAAACPLVIDPSGVYFRSEGSDGRFICGVSPKPSEDPDCASVAALEEINHSLFDEVIWPALYRRVPAFGELKVTGVWAGFYDYNTVDQNAILGRHPQTDNLLLANGFSGHGLQQAPAVGRALAELLLYGEYRTLDLSRLGLTRLMEGRPLYEENIV